MDVEHLGPQARETQTTAARACGFARGLAAAAFALLAAGCGGGGGGDDNAPTAAPRPAVLATAPAYGPATEALPAGAQAVDLADLERMAAAGDELLWFTPASEAAVGDSDALRRQTARAEVEAALGTQPGLAEVLRAPGALPAGALRRADGTVEVSLWDGGPKVVLDPLETAIGDAAYALRMANSRDNALALYRGHWDVLADDLRAGLPDPADTANLSLEALHEAAARAAELVIEHVPNLAPPEAAASASTGGSGRAQALGAARRLSSFSPGCQVVPYSAANIFNFTLKPHLGPVRSQGSRGSCSSFAAAGAVEIKASRSYGRKPDLSEQHLYSMARLDWFRVSGDVAEGMDSGDLLDKLTASNYQFRSEPLWSYNPSPDRETTDDGYIRSCAGYGEACSDTNHQAGRACAQYGGQWFCFWRRPAQTQGNVAEQYRMASKTWLGKLGVLATSAGVASQTLQHIRAHVSAGNPVYLSIDWAECMKRLKTDSGGWDDGINALLTVPVCERSDGDTRLGGHAVVIVGYVSTLDLLADLGAPSFRLPDLDGNPVTDGFFIIRNSHSCDWGDAGYGYFSSAMLRRFGKNAWSVNLASASNLPSVSLATSRSVIDAPGQTFTLTATPGPTVQRVEFYKLNNNTTPPSSTKLMDRMSAPYTFQPAVSMTSPGTHRFYAVGYDAGDNPAKSLVVEVRVVGSALPKPTLNLSANTTQVTVPGSVTVTAQGLKNTTPLRRLQFFKNGEQFANYEYPLSLNQSEITRAVMLPFVAADAGIVRIGAKLTDDAGASNTAEIDITVTVPAAPTISAFGATPATAPPGGGPVTLAWTASNFQSLFIDPVGSVTSLNALQVSPSVTTTYVLTASSQGGTASASTTVTVPPPQVASFTATPTSLPVGGGPVTLSWNVVGATSVSINNGVGSVAGSGSVVVNPQVSTSWTLLANAPSGSSNASAAVTVAGDGVPPTVALAASTTTVDVPGSVTLTATASDNVGVVAVDFYRGATRIGTDTTPGDGYTQTVAFTQADVGNVSFTAQARDPAGNVGTSTPVVVTVRLPAPLGVDRWVAPGGNDAHTGSEGAPYLTVGKALANIGANGTVWLAPGSYPWANEINRNGVSQVDYKVLRVPDTGRVRAVTRGTVTLQFGLQALGTAVVSGVHFTLLASDVSDVQPAVLSKAASGTLRLERTTFGRMNTLQSSAGGNTLFTAESDDSHEWFTPDFQGAIGRVDLGQTRFLGGRITLTRIPDGGNAGVRVWGNYGGSGVLSIERVQMTLPEAPVNVSQVMFTPIGGGTLTFFNSQVVQQGTRTSHVLAQNDHLSQVRLLNSTVSGPFGQIVSLTVGGNVEVNGSTLSGGVTAIGFAGGQEPGGVAMPSVQILDSTLRNFSAHGLFLPNHGNVLVSGSTLRDNGQSGVFLGGTPNLPWVTANYVLRVQTSTFSGNGGSGGAGHGGLVLAGSASSTWDLGGSNGNGDSTLLGTASAPALRVAVPAGVTVLAVGNTWTPSVQGANASGRYGADVLVNSGSGVNYGITSGALRLSW